MISTAQLLCVHFMVGMSLLQSHAICVIRSNPFYCDTDCKADRGLKEMAGAGAVRISSETRQLRIALTLEIYRNIFRHRELSNHPPYDLLRDSPYNG